MTQSWIRMWKHSLYQENLSNIEQKQFQKQRLVSADTMTSTRTRQADQTVKICSINLISWNSKKLFLNQFQNPAFLEKFIINDVLPSDINDETVLEFQVYSSHHVTRRHLVGVASISLRAIETLENGLVDLTIMPQTVCRVSTKKILKLFLFSYEKGFRNKTQN